MTAVSVVAIGVNPTLTSALRTLVKIPTSYVVRIEEILIRLSYICLTEKYSVRCIAFVTIACQSPGVIVAIVAVAVVAAILESIHQLLLIARGFAPSPFTLLKRLNQKILERLNPPEPSPLQSPPQWRTIDLECLP